MMIDSAEAKYSMREHFLTIFCNRIHLRDGDYKCGTVKLACIILDSRSRYLAILSRYARILIVQGSCSLNSFDFLHILS